MESLTLGKKQKVNSQLESQDEPMDINEAPFDASGEEGEINSSDDERSISKQCPTNLINVFTSNYKIQAEELFSNSNALNKDEVQKKLDRAKRFSLSVQTVDPDEIYNVKLSNLYKDLGIDKENERHYRFNAIHMRGTENMSTDDVLQYFVSYAPSHVEWINDISCNIIWMDDVSTATALLNLSKRIKNLDKVHLNADPFEKDYKNYSCNKEINDDDDDDDDDDGIDAREIATAIPPGFWRIGIPCKKSSCLLLRYATRSDKKQRNAEKNSEYYKKYGNPHYGNIPGLISNSLRSGVRKLKFKISDSTSSMSDQGEKRNPWEELAYEWGKGDEKERKDERYIRSRVQKRSQISDLRISLTNRKERAKRLKIDSETNLNYPDKETWESRSKIPRMKMYADDEEKRLEENCEKRFLKTKFKSQPEKDLRSKINKKKAGLRFKFTSEKKPASESSNTESENDEIDSGEWALEQYHDLREALVQNKRQEQNQLIEKRYFSDDEDSDNVNDRFNERDFNIRTPLQIEIENDEYYCKKI